MLGILSCEYGHIDFVSYCSGLKYYMDVLWGCKACSKYIYIYEKIIKTIEW